MSDFQFLFSKNANVWEFEEINQNGKRLLAIYKLLRINFQMYIPVTSITTQRESLVFLQIRITLINRILWSQILPSIKLADVRNPFFIFSSRFVNGRTRETIGKNK